MKHKSYTSFEFPSLETPQGLLGRIMARIEHEHHLRTLRYRIIGFAVCGVLSGIALVPAFNLLREQFTQSGMFQYISLFFSDPQILLTYWQEFLSSVGESLPVFALVYVLILAMTALWSLDAFFHDTINFLRIKPLSHQKA